MGMMSDYHKKRLGSQKKRWHIESVNTPLDMVEKKLKRKEYKRKCKEAQKSLTK